MGGATNSKTRIGYISAQNKSAQYDTITITNASKIYDQVSRLSYDNTGTSATVVCAITASANVIYFNDVATGTVSGTIIYE